MPLWGGRRERGPAVLLVEDDDDHAALAARALRHAARVVRARCGADVERLLTTEPFDAVVLDYRLPDADGLDVLAIVRSRAPGTPVLMLTGEGSEALAMRALSLGASDYMQKGAGVLDELAARVGALVETRAAAGQEGEGGVVQAFAAATATARGPAADPKVQAALEAVVQGPLVGLALLDGDGRAIASRLPPGCRAEALGAAARGLHASAVEAGRASDLAPVRLRIVLEGAKATLVAASLPRGLLAVGLVEPGRGRDRALRDLDEALSRLREGMRRGEG